MSYDDQFAERVRKIFGNRSDVTEKKMFGGLAFMLNNNMCGGVNKTDFMVRVGREAYVDMLTQPHARPMDFTGKPLKTMVFVGPDGCRSDTDLQVWIDRAIAITETLPHK